MDKNVIYGLKCTCHPERGIRYVGQSCQGIRVRFYKHIYAANSGKPWVVSRWMRKHGVENIEWEVLETVESREDLGRAEEKWINQLKTQTKFGGCNVTPGGDAPSGYQHPEGSLSRKRGIRKLSEETKNRIRENAFRSSGEENFNAKMTDEKVKETLIRAWKGETASSIAVDMEVSVTVISLILTGKAWTHVPRPIGPREKAPTGRIEKGSRPKNTKLTEDQVREIRRRYDNGERPRDLGPEYGVSPGTISMVGRRAVWKSVD